MFFECPGSIKIKQPTPQLIKCPACSGEVEIWTDEFKAVCPYCKTTVMQSSVQSCLDWCKFAKECVGEETFSNYMNNKSLTIRDKLLEELEKYFGNDVRRINHAKKVLHFAEELLSKEKADWHIVLPSSILHDVGIKISEEKYGSSAPQYQEKEGPPVAKDILLKIGVRKEAIDEICKIIANHHSPGKIDTQNFKVLYDADWLANLKEAVDMNGKAKAAELIDKVFLTETGKKIARNIYLS